MNIISYDKITLTLIVEFPGDLCNDRVHEFYDIPHHIYASLKASDDPAGYFNANIWGKRFEKKVHWGGINNLLKYLEEHMMFDAPLTSGSARSDGDTPLHIASVWGDIGALKLLLDAGADVNAKGDMGCTSLYNAISWGHKRSVELLLQYRATPYDSNEFGTSSYKLAMTEGNEAIADIVKKYIPKRLI